MDFTKIVCISESCKDKKTIMNGAGGSFGGRVQYAKVECPDCGLMLLITTLKKDLVYKLSAQTKEEIQIEQEQKRHRKEIKAQINKLINELDNV